MRTRVISEDIRSWIARKKHVICDTRGNTIREKQLLNGIHSPAAKSVEDICVALNWNEFKKLYGRFGIPVVPEFVRRFLKAAPHEVVCRKSRDVRRGRAAVTEHPRIIGSVETKTPKKHPKQNIFTPNQFSHHSFLHSSQAVRIFYRLLPGCD